MSSTWYFVWLCYPMVHWYQYQKVVGSILCCPSLQKCAKDRFYIIFRTKNVWLINITSSPELPDCLPVELLDDKSAPPNPDTENAWKLSFRYLWLLIMSSIAYFQATPIGRYIFSSSGKVKHIKTAAIKKNVCWRTTVLDSKHN